MTKLEPVLRALELNEAERNGAETNRAMKALGLPYPTSIGRVRAGDWSSSVPDRAVAEGRYGVRIDQTVAEAEAELRAVVEAACGGDDWLAEHPVTVEISGGRFASCAVGSDHPLPWGWARPPATCSGGCPRLWVCRTARTRACSCIRARPPRCCMAPATRVSPTPPTSMWCSRTSHVAHARLRFGYFARPDMSQNSDNPVEPVILRF